MPDINNNLSPDEWNQWSCDNLVGRYIVFDSDEGRQVGRVLTAIFSGRADPGNIADFKMEVRISKTETTHINLVAAGCTGPYATYNDAKERTI